MAYYHTYRPQNFNDIWFTQPKAAEMLVSAILAERVAHAYLFTGSHGIGKTSSARILAKALNCEKFSEVTGGKKVINEKLIASFPVPCNECANCLSVTNGSAVDIVEMDAASNRGIDDIRELRERVRLMPAALSKKVYIIDEVHMLTTEAFNALLKTLEEPPKHTLFILCTTDKEKVPLTIQSRCTSIVFHRPTVETISGYITRIADAEKLKIEGEAVTFIARLARGAFRDAAKYVEQAALLGFPITLEKVQSHFVGGDTNSVEQMLVCIYEGNLQKALVLIRSFEEAHVHFSELERELIDRLRELILYKSGVMKKDELPLYTSFDVDQFCNTRDIAFMSESIESLMKALGQQKTTPIAALPLELAFIKLLSPAQQTVVVNQAPVPEKVAPREQAPQKVSTVKTAQQKTASEPIQKKEVVSNLAAVQIVEAPPVEEKATVVADGPVSLDVVQNRWGEVVRLVKKYNASMASLMTKCKPVKMDGKIVTVETNYSFHKDMLESAKNRPVIEQAIYELLGAQLRVKGALSNTRLTPKQVENVVEVQNEDLVAAVQEIFGA